MRPARFTACWLGTIPSNKVAHVRVIMRLPPLALSIRRTVVPIGSEGVIPQAGLAPKLAQDVLGQIWCYDCIKKHMHQPASREAKAFKMSICGQNDLFRRQISLPVRKGP